MQHVRYHFLYNDRVAQFIIQQTCFWNNEILTPIQKNGMEGPGKTAFKKLRVLLDRMMLRRTKVCLRHVVYLNADKLSRQIQRADDLGLPPRTVIVRRDYFSPEEKELYLSLFSDAKREFSTYVDSGTVLNSELLIPPLILFPHAASRLFEYLQLVSIRSPGFTF
jgi:hypothetical protein